MPAPTAPAVALTTTPAAGDSTAITTAPAAPTIVAAITTAPAAPTIAAAITTAPTSAAVALTTTRVTPTATAAFLALATAAIQRRRRVRRPSTKPPATVPAEKRATMRPEAVGAGKCKRNVSGKGMDSGGVGGGDGATKTAKRVRGTHASPAAADPAERKAITPPGAAEAGKGNDDVSGKGMYSGGVCGGNDATQTAERVRGPHASPAAADPAERKAPTPPGATEAGKGNDNVSGKGTGSGDVGGGGGGDEGQREERVWDEQELRFMRSDIWDLLDDPEFLSFVEEVKEAAEGLT